MMEQELEAYLREALARPVRIRINDNERTLVRTRPEPGPAGELVASVHRLFLSAPAPVLEALARFLLSPDRDSRAALRAFAEETPLEAELPRDRPVGRHADLRAEADALNHEYFQGALRFAIEWGQARIPPTKGRKRRLQRHIQLGLWIARRRLVRVHPALDDAWVPDFYRHSVIHHELCHIAVPAVRDAAGRLLVHTRAFRELEGRFAHHEAALEWQRKHLTELLRRWSARSTEAGR